MFQASYNATFLTKRTQQQLQTRLTLLRARERGLQDVARKREVMSKAESGQPQENWEETLADPNAKIPMEVISTKEDAAKELKAMEKTQKVGYIKFVLVLLRLGLNCLF